KLYFGTRAGPAPPGSTFGHRPPRPYHASGDRPARDRSPGIARSEVGGPAVAGPSSAPAGLRHEVPGFGQDELLHREAQRLRRPRERDHDLAADEPRARAREHRGAADLLEREPAEELAEARDRALEERFERRHRDVARR